MAYGYRRRFGGYRRRNYTRPRRAGFRGAYGARKAYASKRRYATKGVATVMRYMAAVRAAKARAALRT